MFVEEIRRAIAAAARETLPGLAASVWKAFAAGAIGEGDAQALAEAVEARKAVPAASIARRRVGSRPRSPESLERRRRWAASGLRPPQLACRFTLAEAAALAVVAAEASKRGACKLTIGHIAALAGVGRSTVRNAIREAVALGLLRSEEWRLSAWRSAPNTVTVVSPEWQAWLRLARRRGGGVKTMRPTPTGSREKVGQQAQVVERKPERSSGGGSRTRAAGAGAML